MVKCNCHGKGNTYYKKNLGATTSKDNLTCDACGNYVFHESKYINVDKREISEYEPIYEFGVMDFIEYGEDYDFYIDNCPEHFCNKNKILK